MLPGLVATTWAVPALAISAAEIAAVTRVEETKVVAFAAPFHFTAAPDTKPVPFTVSVNAADPAVTEVGESVVKVGGEALAAPVPIPMVCAPPGTENLSDPWALDVTSVVVTFPVAVFLIETG